MRKMLYLHLGLPKTATTFLQTELFPRIPNLIYVDRNQVSLSGWKLDYGLPVGFRHMRMKLIRRSLNSPKTFFGFIAIRILIRISRLRPILISNENLSIRKMGIWDNSGLTLDQQIEKLENLAKLFVGTPTKLIVGFRKPDTWLASRYAQSANQMFHPCQEDFELRVHKLLLEPSRVPAATWLFHEDVKLKLEEAFGAKNCVFYELEDFEENPLTECEKILDFFEVDTSKKKQLLSEIRFSERSNVKRIDEKTWKLKGGNGSITLTEDLSGEIRTVFGRGMS